jgi:hypothetical protein
MKKSKNSKRTRARSRQTLTVDAEAVSILRTVADHEAFHFYEDVGKPTGQMARNLSDFLDMVKSVKQESLMFHLQRRDFQNWVQETLGDYRLGEKLGNIPPENSDGLRTIICRMVENRLKELQESSMQIMVDDGKALLLTSP